MYKQNKQVGIELTFTNSLNFLQIVWYLWMQFLLPLCWLKSPDVFIHAGRYSSVQIPLQMAYISAKKVHLKFTMFMIGGMQRTQEVLMHS